MRFPEALGCGTKKKKNSSAKSEIPPLKLFIKSVLETPAPNNTGYCHCSSLFTGTLLKMPYDLVIGDREIKLVLTTTGSQPKMIRHSL